MPKRTTPRQRVLAYIHRQLAPLEAKVSESAELQEGTSGAMREVDILIEQSVVGLPSRVAVEFRDRGRRSDLEWIDQLIGKYADLGVDKVIAVSASGFSDSALRKARRHGVDARTLEGVLAAEWPTEFAKLGIGKLSRRDHLLSATLDTTPPLEEKAGATDPVTDTEGEELCSLLELIQHCLDTVCREAVSAFYRDNFLNVFRVLSDVTDRQPVVEVSGLTPAREVFIVDERGERRRLRSATLRVRSVFAVQKAGVGHRRYESALISSAHLELEAQPQAVAVNAVQFADRPGEARVFWMPTAGSRSDTCDQGCGPSVDPQADDGR